MRNTFFVGTKSEVKKRGHSQDRLNKLHHNGYYDYLCSDNFRLIYDYAASFISKGEARSVLDVGCWNGVFYRAVKDLGKTVKYSGYDLSDDAVNFAHKKYANKDVSFYAHDWNDDFKEVGNVDLIYFGGVFYYIDDKPGFLKRFIRQHSPKVVVIQDLQATDLSSLVGDYDTMGYRKFKIEYDINEPRRMRQVLALSVR